MLKKCKHCGKEFKTQLNHQQFCTAECRREHTREKELEKKCKITGDRIVQINELARRAGMSYGKYVAKMNEERKRNEKK